MVVLLVILFSSGLVGGVEKFVGLVGGCIVLFVYTCGIDMGVLSFFFSLGC